MHSGAGMAISSTLHIPSRYPFKDSCGVQGYGFIMTPLIGLADWSESAWS